MNTAFQPSGNEVKHAAFSEHRRSGRLRASQGVIVNALTSGHLGMTRNELTAATGLPLARVCGRCRELLDLGHVEVVGMSADKPARQKLALTEQGRGEARKQEAGHAKAD